MEGFNFDGSGDTVKKKNTLDVASSKFSYVRKYTTWKQEGPYIWKSYNIGHLIR